MPEPDTTNSPFSPDVLREQAVARREKLVVRLQDELDRMLKILAHCREAVENELMEGMGYKRLAVPDKLLKKTKELASMMGSVTEAKIRFDKAQKALADSMTPEEERKAVIAYVASLEPAERAKLMLEFKRVQYRKGEIEGNYSGMKRSDNEDSSPSE